MFKQLQQVCLVIVVGSFLSLASMNVRAEIDWSEIFISAFEEMGSDLSQIEKNTNQYSTKSWYRTSVLDVALVGGGACAIPTGGHVTLPAEFLYLVREIYNSSLGLGFLIYGDANKDDFATILGVWSDAILLDDETLHQLFEAAEWVASEAAEEVVEDNVKKAMEYVRSHYALAGTVGSSTSTFAVKNGTKKGSSKVISKLIAKKVGAKAAGKLSATVATKTGTKIGAKYAVKGMAAWIPVVSAGVCAGLNAWIMDGGVMTAAENYYRQLARVRNQRYKSNKI